MSNIEEVKQQVEHVRDLQQQLDIELRKLDKLRVEVKELAAVNEIVSNAADSLKYTGFVCAHMVSKPNGKITISVTTDNEYPEFIGNTLFSKDFPEKDLTDDDCVILKEMLTCFSIEYYED